MSAQHHLRKKIIKLPYRSELLLSFCCIKVIFRSAAKNGAGYT